MHAIVGQSPNFQPPPTTKPSFCQSPTEVHLKRSCVRGKNEGSDSRSSRRWDGGMGSMRPYVRHTPSWMPSTSIDTKRSTDSMTSVPSIHPSQSRLRTWREDGLGCGDEGYARRRKTRGFRDKTRKDPRTSVTIGLVFASTCTRTSQWSIVGTADKSDETRPSAAAGNEGRGRHITSIPSPRPGQGAR